jgi:hypothetical protein
LATTPGSARPRFPGFDALDQATNWDLTTRRVVLGRLTDRPSRAFFTAAEEPTARALLDRLLAQDDEPRVPVFEIVDRRLATRSGDGYRYADLPEDPEAWRASITHLDADARLCCRCRFSDLPKSRQRRMVEDVRTATGNWHGMPGARLFSLWMRYACSAFYSHPWAWNEMGFGGPAYPRGYKNLGIDRREPWEVAEVQPVDPVPWIERAESARRRHSESLSSDDKGFGPVDRTEGTTP